MNKGQTSKREKSINAATAESYLIAALYLREEADFGEVSKDTKLAERIGAVSDMLRSMAGNIRPPGVRLNQRVRNIARKLGLRIDDRI